MIYIINKPYNQGLYVQWVDMLKATNLPYESIVIDNLEIDKVINSTMTFIRSINVFMEKNEPWKLVKEDKNKAGNILFHCAEALRLSSILLSPVMPSKSENILQILGTKEKSLVWGKIKPSSSITLSKPIFPRIN